MQEINQQINGEEIHENIAESADIEIREKSSDSENFQYEQDLSDIAENDQNGENLSQSMEHSMIEVDLVEAEAEIKPKRKRKSRKNLKEIFAVLDPAAVIENFASLEESTQENIAPDLIELKETGEEWGDTKKKRSRKRKEVMTHHQNF